MTASLNEHERPSMEKPLADSEMDVWQAFAAPRSDQEFCQAWLALLCRQLTGVTAGVALLQSAESGTFLPVAVWPEVTKDLSFLGKAAERALVEARGVVLHPEDGAKGRVHIAYPIEISGRMLGAVVLEASTPHEAEVHALLRQLHWGAAWLRDLFHRRELASVEEKADRIGSVMEVIATSLRQSRLQQVLFDIANHLASHLNCSRVAIGSIKSDVMRISAMSNAAWVEKNTSIVKLYAAAMEEACDRLSPVAYQRASKEEEDLGDGQASAHSRLAAESGAHTILTMPLQLGGKCIGAVTVERNAGAPLNAAETAWLEALTGLLPAVIDQKRRAERGYLIHLRDDIRSLLSRLFGPRHLIWKFGATLAVLVVALLTLVEMEYRVTAKTVIEGEVQRAVVAPFETFVTASHVRPGDTVRKGQLLCELDDRDLKLEQQKWSSEREQYVRKLREAMANRELPAVQVLSAQVQQADAQLALATERLARVKVTAAFDGVVISGDLSQLIGSPVEQGKKLFEIAPLEAYRVILQVDEREMRQVTAGQNGKLVISGIAGDAIPLKVSKVTPVATARDGRNFFRVEAALSEAPPHLRPGMEGVGKINVGEQRLWWILTHSLTDWLRLKLWTWLP